MAPTTASNADAATTDPWRTFTLSVVAFFTLLVLWFAYLASKAEAASVVTSTPTGATIQLKQGADESGQEFARRVVRESLKRGQ